MADRLDEDIWSLNLYNSSIGHQSSVIGTLLYIFAR